MSSPPQNAMPARLRDNTIGTEIFRYSQLATLSPVHTAPVSQAKPITTNGTVKHGYAEIWRGWKHFHFPI